ncbi:MAG: hypothetical protein JXA89_25485 [Anaerolineae bacterium]|nr:hypothetical protein [Anaerolineae bacterium]
MPLFQKKENQTEEEKKLAVVLFWLFVVAIFSWVLPFTVLFLVGLVQQSLGAGGAIATALVPSMLTFAVSAVLCVIVYLAYKKVVLKI